MYKDVFMALFQHQIFKPKIKSRKIFKLIIVCCILVQTHTNAQSFSFKAALPTVDSPAFYKIKLSPSIISKSVSETIRNGLNLFRIPNHIKANELSPHRMARPVLL